MNRDQTSIMTRRQALCQAGTGLGMLGLVTPCSRTPGCWDG